MQKKVFVLVLLVLTVTCVAACGEAEPSSLVSDSPPEITLVDGARFRRGQSVDINDLIVDISAEEEYTVEYLVMVDGYAVAVDGSTFVVNGNTTHAVYVKATGQNGKWSQEKLNVPVDVYLTDFEQEAAYAASLYNFGKSSYNEGAKLSLSDFTKTGEGKSLLIENTNYPNNWRTVLRVENKQNWHSLSTARSIRYEIYVKASEDTLSEMQRRSFDASGNTVPLWMTPWIYADANDIAYANQSAQKWTSARLNEWTTVTITNIQYSGSDTKDTLYLQALNVEHVWLLNHNWSGGTGFDVDIYIDNIIVNYL